MGCFFINLQEFNYFCTFTYDDKLHTEDTFKTKLSNCLSNFTKQKGWKYIGVWERSPEKKRLHFHGIFFIPDDVKPEFYETRDYNTRNHQMQTTYQDPYFVMNFGRCDFEPINDKLEIGSMIQYIV